MAPLSPRDWETLAQSSLRAALRYKNRLVSNDPDSMRTRGVKVGAQVFGYFRRECKVCTTARLACEVRLIEIRLQLRELTYSGCHCEGVDMIREWRTEMC